MSKLTTVLHAAAFFLLVSDVGSLKFRDRNEIQSTVRMMRTCVTTDVEDISRRISGTIELLDGKYLKTLTALKEKMANRLEKTRRMVNEFFADANNTVFNETKCRIYYDDYEKEEKDIDSNLRAVINVTVNVTLERLRKVQEGMEAAIQNLNDLVIASRWCYLKDCLTHEQRARDIYTHIFRLTVHLSWFDQKPSEVLDFPLQMAFDAFVQKGHDVLLNTFTCVFNGHPPRLRPRLPFHFRD